MMSEEPKKVQGVLKTWTSILKQDPEKRPHHTFRLDDPIIEEPPNRGTSETFIWDPSKKTNSWRGYTLAGELAKGGMGTIHKSTQHCLRRTVVLKTPNSVILHDRFLEEALISGYLNHPNIIVVHDLLTKTDDSLGMVMPLIEGISWKEKLAKEYQEAKGRLPNKQVRIHLDYLLKVCQAISYAHHRGVLHNDIKTENVMVGDFGDVVVMDWGCATQNPSNDIELPFRILHPNQIQNPFGSPCYMSPELATGSGKDIGPWSDGYLLGMMLYEIIEGREPRQGGDIIDIIEQACQGTFDAFQVCSSPTLIQICKKALSPAIEDRYQGPDEFEKALRGYLRAEQSEKIVRTAKQVLDAEAKVLATNRQEQQARLITLIEVVSMYQQAYQLWYSKETKAGEKLACRQLITRAIEMGDLDIASAYINRLSREQNEDIFDSLQQAQQVRELEQQAYKRSTRVTRSVLVLLFLGLVLAGILINQARQTAVEQQQISQDRLGELISLSDVQTAQYLQYQLEELWPLLPEQIPALQEWLSQAQGLLQRKEKHNAHYEQLLLRSAGSTKEDIVEWELGMLASLVGTLNKLEESDLNDVESRIAFSSTVMQKSILDAEEQWDRAINSIRSSPLYNGLQIKPQLGLIPLRENPSSGLWEFLHLQSGEAPDLQNDQWSLSAETGIILVLIPENSFWMGAQQTGNTNRDPRAKDSEGPPHIVSLKPFFISKYELTQAQWQRIMKTNPAAYPIGTEVKPKSITALHPIEQITWKEAKTSLHRYGLILPTEAQWESVARGLLNPKGSQPKSNSVFWTGDEVASLQGTLNISDAAGRALGSPESWQYEQKLSDGHIVHAPVGSFRANPLGLYDTMGNVWEWCSDGFGSYTLPTEEGTGRRITDEKASRLFRGGGFRASSVHARSADRYSIYGSDYRAYDVGIRPARSVE